LKKENPELTFQTDKGSVAMTRFASLSDAVSQAQLHALDMQTALAGAQANPNDAEKIERIAMALQGKDSRFSEGNQQLLAAYQEQKRWLDEAREKLGPNHDMVIQAQRRMQRLADELNQATAQTTADNLKIIQEAVDAANARVTDLHGELEKERQSAVSLNVKEVEYEQLAQEAQRTERALDLIDGRMKEVNVTEDVGALTVSVLETAKPSFLPVRPKKPQTLGIALVAGLMIGVGGAILRDMMDQRLRSAEEVSALLGLPILGAVPHIQGKASINERGQEVAVKPHSEVAEAYRTVRTGVSFGASSQQRPAKSILITSPAPGEGKSTSASNLAIAMAQAGRRTLLIDADCRRPVQHKIFKPHNDSLGLPVS
jgi:capsular polysaccharide biosynthesis protein